MNLGLQNRVVVVAGSSRGIGLAIAHEFLVEGSRVVLNGRDREALSSAEDRLRRTFGADRVIAHAGDTADPATAADVISAARAKWDRVDCVVANVGSGTARPGWELSDADWSTVFETNFGASRRLVEAALPALTQQRAGSIILTASIAGVESLAAPLTYSAAKAALISYSKNLARQVGSAGIRVNAVAPGNVLVPGGAWERKLAANGDEVRAYINREVPLARFGSPEEIAAIVVFLASDRASFVTGACLIADGGQTRAFAG